MKQSAEAQFLKIFNNPQILLSPDVLARTRAAAAAHGQQSLALFNIAIKAVKIGLAQGIHNVFVLSMGLMIAGLIAVFFLKEIPLRGGRSRDAAITEAVEDVSPEGNMAAMI